MSSKLLSIIWNCEQFYYFAAAGLISLDCLFQLFRFNMIASTDVIWIVNKSLANLINKHLLGQNRNREQSKKKLQKTKPSLFFRSQRKNVYAHDEYERWKRYCRLIRLVLTILTVTDEYIDLIFTQKKKMNEKDICSFYYNSLYKPIRCSWFLFYFWYFISISFLFHLILCLWCLFWAKLFFF